MFGYVVADMSSLTQEQKDTYRSYYCGLCHCLHREYGSVQRLVLNYDMTFLILLYTSLYDLPEQTQERRCIVHPFKKQRQTINDATCYAAAMNIALSYYKCVDDWRDDRSYIAALFSKLLKKSIHPVQGCYEEKLERICNCLDALSALETQNIQDPDQASDLFGKLLGEVFVWKEDRWSDTLFHIGHTLGQFIYLTDAILDLPDDVKKDRYNPLRARWHDGFTKESYLPLLKIILGDCMDAFDRLPLIEHTDLLHNILYSGIWTRYYQDKQKNKEENHV